MSFEPVRALAAAAVLVCACNATYDPTADLEYRVYPDTRSAVSAILAEADSPRVYAIGEYHEQRNTQPHRTPIQRFTNDIIGLLVPTSHHLIVEAWLDNSCQAPRVDVAPVPAQVTQVTGRKIQPSSDLEQLLQASDAAHLEAHGLPVTCIEQDSIVDDRGRVDFLLLLRLVTDKLGDTTRALLEAEPGKAVIVYGGALHNDLYPNWPLDQLSYAAPLSRELGGHVLEIDLVVPEVIAPMSMVRYEPWFPLIGLTSPTRTIVWQRGPDSYVVILPSQTEAIAAMAKPVLKN